MRKRRACARGARRSIARFATRRAISLDGVTIGLHMNAGLLVDMPHLAETGAKSIGLFRTELQFMLASRFPRPGAQEAALSRDPRRGRRPAGHLPHPRHRRRQAAALHEGARGGKPGARLARDAHRARPAGAAAHAVARVAARRRGARSQGHGARWSRRSTSSRRRARCSTANSPWLAGRGYEPPRTVQLGVMVEVPSLLWQIDEIAAAADFLSVGSNDLMQYLYAVDRDNRRVADRFDPLSVGLPAGVAVDRRSGRAARNAGDAVRRNRRAAARGDGADGDRLPRAARCRRPRSVRSRR